MYLRSSLKRVALIAGLSLLTLSSIVSAPRVARAEALLVVEADTGRVLQADNATYPWYPASVTKLMTAYVTLKAVKDGRLTLDSLLTVSPTAAAQQPSKMGFRSGTQVTVDNALKMMMVKSANDMAVVLAEGVAGSIDGFSEEMNRTALGLGMTQTNYVNPNGLPAEGQVTSARDLAILARAIIRDLPEYEYFVHIPSIRFGRRVTQNFNRLIGRFPGADGMKTGFICASGFNLVASATRNGKRLIAVVLGAPSSQMRAVRAAQLLERGFSNTALTWLRPSLGIVDNLAPIDAAPPNLRDEMCGPKRKRPATETEDDTVASNAGGSASGGETGVVFFMAGLQAPSLKPTEMLSAAPAPSEPVIVYTGPKKTGTDLIAAVAVETAKQTPKPKTKRTSLAAKKDAAEVADSKSDTNSSDKAGGRKTLMIDTQSAAAPARVRQAGVKPNAAAKPAASAAPSQRPAKPKVAAKPKPAPKGDGKTSDAKSGAKPGDKS